MDDLRGPEARTTGERAGLRGERKQVTVLFMDVVNSMELTRTLGMERWGSVLDRFLELACGTVQELDGNTNQFHGDGLMAVFGAPLGQEDHARRACLAALATQRSIQGLAEELERSAGVELAIRCGLDSGEVVVGEIGEDFRMEFAPIGNVGGLAKRVEALAPAGSTALSETTASLVSDGFELRDLGEFELKGADGGQRVFELLGERRPGLRGLRPGGGELSRFVGRGDERHVLDEALARALAGDGLTVGIRGEPGVGKSRLVYEATREWRRRGLRVDSGRAVGHGRATPLRPIVDLLRNVFDVEAGEEPRDARVKVEAALLGLDPVFAPERPLLLDFLGLANREEFAERIDPDARRRRLLDLIGALLEAGADRQARVLVIEDLHWLDPASAAFVERIVAAVAGTRALLIVTHRPEYAPGWHGRDAFEQLDLGPLPVEASGDLLRALLGEDPALNTLIERLRERTGGNPFFIEEAVRDLVGRGVIDGPPGAYRSIAEGEPTLPPTVQATLDARIDRLPSREKALLRAMSAIGKDVDRSVLHEIAGLGAEKLEVSIARLAESEFVRELAPRGDLTFKHPLTQAVAYRSQLSEPRARLHGEIAAALERLYPDELDARAALIAHHREAAGEFLRAAQWYARAATWALVPAPVESIGYWERARELAAGAEDDPEARRLAVLSAGAILGLAWRAGMSHEQTAAIHAEARRLLDADAPSFEGVLLDVAYGGNLGLGERVGEGKKLMRRASAAAEAIGDPGLVLNANCYAALGAWVEGDSHGCVALTDRALALAGEDASAGAGLVTGNPYAHCLWIRAAGRMMLGDLDSAERDFQRSVEVARAFSDPLCELSAFCTAGLLGLHRLEPGAFIADVEGAAGDADRIGDAQIRVAVRASLAYLQAEKGLFEQALVTAAEALEISGDLKAGLIWRPELLAATARAELGQGELVSAREKAEEAVAFAEAHGLLRSVVLARITLIRVLIAAAGPGESARLEEIADLLDGLSSLAAKIDYRSIEPQILIERATLARLRGEDEEAERREAEAGERLRELDAPAIR